MGKVGQYEYLYQDYLNNKHSINLIDIKTVPFDKKPIKIYEVVF